MKNGMTMLEQRQVKIRCDSKIIERKIEITTSTPWELRLLSESEKEIEYSCKGTDLFECLTMLRSKYLEKKECFILCNGSRMDVYPSRMSRQMSGGKKAYVIRLGKQARRSDLIDIFNQQWLRK